MKLFSRFDVAYLVVHAQLAWLYGDRQTACRAIVRGFRYDAALLHLGAERTN